LKKKARVACQENAKSSKSNAYLFLEIGKQTVCFFCSQCTNEIYIYKIF